jgi:hypothetical protein
LPDLGKGRLLFPTPRICKIGFEPIPGVVLEFFEHVKSYFLAFFLKGASIQRSNPYHGTDAAFAAIRFASLPLKNATLISV